MDLVSRMDPELAVAFPDLTVLDLSDIPRAREVMLAMLEEKNSYLIPDPLITRRDQQVPGVRGAPDVRVRTYHHRDHDGTRPGLYWIHGGGHCLGSVDQTDLMAEYFVRTIGCVVASVDWRLPPEHPFPAPMDDCYSGLIWMFENAEQLGVDRTRIAVGGESGGGGLAAGLALLARDRGEVALCYQLLIYPMIDDRAVTPSSQMVTAPQLWNRDLNAIGWGSYLAGRAGTKGVSPYAAPARADDLSGLPPAYVAVGELDLFFDENVSYAQRLVQAGGSAELHVYPRAFHGFDLLVPHAQVSERLRRDRDDALYRALHAGP